ncbi:MAG: hypothetical protein KJ062_16830, partial [Thermoanaerobaculia bacterium]|nr:hypothetical protein [Thermoanaerobaculia bacterium]
MHLGGRRRQVGPLEEARVFGKLGRPPVLVLEDLRVRPLLGNALRVVRPVVGDAVDEEEAQDLDPAGTQAHLLVEVLLDRPPDHLALKAERFHVSESLSRAEEVLTAGDPQLQKLLALPDPDLPDPA